MGRNRVCAAGGNPRWEKEVKRQRVHTRCRDKFSQQVELRDPDELTHLNRRASSSGAETGMYICTAAASIHLLQVILSFISLSMIITSSSIRRLPSQVKTTLPTPVPHLRFLWLVF